MSKLFDQYKVLKQTNPDKVYLFKSGIFYIALQEDAQLLSEELDMRLTNLNDTVVKCGFPSNSFEKYIILLKQKEIDFSIVDKKCPTANENFTDYIHNHQLEQITKEILNIDFDNITFKQAFEELLSVQQSLKNIYHSSSQEE